MTWAGQPTALALSRMGCGNSPARRMRQIVVLERFCPGSGGANYAVVGARDARSRRWRLDGALSRGNHPHSLPAMILR